MVGTVGAASLSPDRTGVGHPTSSGPRPPEMGEDRRDTPHASRLRVALVPQTCAVNLRPCPRSGPGDLRVLRTARRAPELRLLRREHLRPRRPRRGRTRSAVLVDLIATVLESGDRTHRRSERLRDTSPTDKARSVTDALGPLSPRARQRPRAGCAIPAASAALAAGEHQTGHLGCAGSEQYSCHLPKGETLRIHVVEHQYPPAHDSLGLGN